MKTKEQLANNFASAGERIDDRIRIAFLAGYDARESQSVAQAEVSDEEAAERYVIEFGPKGYSILQIDEDKRAHKKLFLAGAKHGRENERGKDYGCGIASWKCAEIRRELEQKIEHERARSAKLVEALRVISDAPHLTECECDGSVGYQCTDCMILRLAGEAVANYEREK